MEALAFSFLGFILLVLSLSSAWYAYLTVRSFSIVENVWEATGQVWALFWYSVLAVFIAGGVFYCGRSALGLRND